MGEDSRPFDIRAVGQAVAESAVHLNNAEDSYFLDEGKNDKPYSWPGEDKAGAYPQTNMFDPYHLPAYGLFVDKSDGVRMENVRFRLRPGTTDARHSLIVMP